MLTYSDVCDDVLAVYSAYVEELCAALIYVGEGFVLGVERHPTSERIHFHCMVDMGQTVVFSDPRYFDIMGKHPKIVPVPAKTLDVKRVFNYCKKDGEWYSNMDSEMVMVDPDTSEVWFRAYSAGSRVAAERLIAEGETRDYFVACSNVDRRLSHLFPPPPPPPYLSPYTVDSFRRDRVLDEWLNHAFMRNDIPRKTALVLYGPSRTGKTAWARSHGGHNYFKSDVALDEYDSTASYNVFDDIENWSKFNLKGWLGGDDFVTSGKYCRQVRVKGGKPAIVICNGLPRFRGEKVEWWIRNTMRFYVQDRLYM